MNGYMEPMMGGGWEDFYQETQEPQDADVQARFRYLRKSEDSSEFLLFAPRFEEDSGEPQPPRVAVVFRPNRAVINEFDGNSWTERDKNYAAGSALDVWYEVFMVVKGSTIEVWRRGEHESDITLILFADDIDLDTTDRRWFRVSQGADWWVDDIGWDVNNLDYFLHLTKFSPCVDQGQSSKPIGNLDLGVNFERDFNDAITPIDVDGVDPPFVPADPPDTEGVHPYDMGAKEYPAPKISSLWWENPLFD